MFYANLRQPGWVKLGVRRQFSLLARAVEPVALRTLSAWGPTPHYVESLNRLQRKMVATLLRMWKYPGEEWRHFRSRQSRAAGRCIEDNGEWWARKWMQRCVRWDKCLQRDYEEQRKLLNCASVQSAQLFKTKLSWAPQLINFLDENWFRERRTICSYHEGRSVSSRTDTRVVRGAVLARWHDRVIFAQSNSL